MNLDVSAWPGTGRLMPRSRVGRWVAEAGQTRVWVLQAGPGSGKAATAHLLGEALGKPVFQLEPGRHPLARLATWLGLPGDSVPERIAEALRDWAQAEAPDGATFMVARADDESGGPEAAAFLRRWVEVADRPHATIITTRREFAWFPPRLVASGDARWFGAPDLWFDPGEVASCLASLEVPAEAVKATCGWPLGVASLGRLAANPGVLGFLEDLAAAELLGTLAPDLAQAALQLWPAADWRPDDVPLDNPDLARALALLVRWGLMVVGPSARATWHPLVRRALAVRHGAAGTAEERKARDWRLGRWLEAADPGRAFDFWLDQREVDAAVGCLARHANAVPPSAEQDRIVATWLERLPPAVRLGDPRVLFAEGSLMLRGGNLGGAAERLGGARTGFAGRHDPASEFAVLGRLLGVHLQREDVAEAEVVATQAAALEESADLGDRVVFRVNRGSLAFLAGDEDGALRHYRGALDLPHLGRSRVALAQQEACLNLAILAFERGEFGQARRALDRALTSHAEFPIDPALPLRAGLQQAFGAVVQGEHAAAAHFLDTARELVRPANPYHQATCLRLEGQVALLLRRHDAARTALRASLDLLHAQGLDRSGDAAATLAALAELSRSQGESEAATVLLDWAEPLARGLPRLQAAVLHCRALALRALGNSEGARDAIALAGRALDGVVARPLGAMIALTAAVLAAETGNRQEVDRQVTQGARLLREGPYYYLPLAIRDLAPRVWDLLDQESHRDFLDATESRFPRAGSAVRAEAAALRAEAASALGAEAASAANTNAVAPRIEIRSFGQVSLKVGSVPAGFGRRKARALLAHLLLAPHGLTRDEAADLLYPDLDWEDARHQVDNLTSLLRRTLSPGIRCGPEAGVLRREDGRYRLDLEAVWWDARAFDAAFEEGAAAWSAGDRAAAIVCYAEALDLFTDDLFAGAELAEWFEATRQSYRGRALQMLERSAEHHLSGGQYETTLRCAGRILQLEPAHEGAHRLLMQVYAVLGEAGLVRRQFDLCAQSLAQLLDVAPSARTRALLAELTAREPAR